LAIAGSDAYGIGTSQKLTAMDVKSAKEIPRKIGTADERR
jgi:hypothetical protein